jgi:hypothetical protein
VGPYQIPPPRDIAGLETCEYQLLPSLVTLLLYRLMLTLYRCPGVAHRSCSQALGHFCGIKT